MFFVASDVVGDGFQGGAHVGDLLGEPGQGPGLGLVDTVLVDDCAQLHVAVEGSAAEVGQLGDRGEGDGELGGARLTRSGQRTRPTVAQSGILTAQARTLKAIIRTSAPMLTCGSMPLPAATHRKHHLPVALRAFSIVNPSIPMKPVISSQPRPWRVEI